MLRRCLAAVAVAALVAVAVLTLPASAAASKSALPLTLGVDVTTGLYATAPIAAFEKSVGQPAEIVQNFISWQYKSHKSFDQFPSFRAKSILAAGSVPEITWNPNINGDASRNQPTLSLESIIRGEHDAYIRTFAKAAAALRAPILIRFGSEMNLREVSYAESSSGNRTGQFVKAWRHVWSIFQEARATNVQWVWSPNIGSSRSALAELYPGNKYVTWVGLDGYSYHYVGCPAVSKVFDPSLKSVESISSRPIMLSEVGVSSACYDKAALITGMFQWLRTETKIRSITWWQRGSYSVTADSAALAAFKTGLAEWRPLATVVPKPNPISTTTTTTTPRTTATTTQPAAASASAAYSGPTTWGLIGDETSTAPSEQAAGITSKVVRISWSDLETSPGVFSAAYASSKQQEIASLESGGIKVILDLGLQGTPSWIHEAPYTDTYLVNQYGENWTSTTSSQTTDDSTANLIFNSTLRTVAAAYIDEVAKDFGPTAQAIRIGGGQDGELDYPPATTPGHSNDYWAFDAAAQQLSPVPGWEPDDPSPDGQAQAFLNWYLASLTNFENWQISTLRSAYAGPIIILLPGWGIRPGQTTAAVADNLDGDSAAEGTDEIPRGDDPTDEVAAINQSNVWVETTWLDAPEYGSDLSTNPDDWTPVHYLHSLVAANPFHPELWGENTGEGSASALTYAIHQACIYDVQGVVWYDENELLSGTYATLPDYAAAIKSGCG